MTLAYPCLTRLVWMDAPSSYPKGVISSVCIRHMMDRAYLSYLAHVWHCSKELPSSKTTSVVREFMDMFPTDFVLSDCEIDFTIDLDSRTKPSPYLLIG